MAKCSLCGKHSLWKKTSDGLCVKCAETLFQKNLADMKVKLSAVQDSYYETNRAKEKAEQDLAELSSKHAELESSVTPEMWNAAELRKLIARLSAEHAQMQAALAADREKLESLHSEILVAGDTLEMESYSLYKPEYDFAHSDDYKAKLDQIRAEQKKMLKDGTAAKCDTAWEVRGSKAEGKKFANEIVKLFLRAFNNECEAAVRDVKFSNFDRCEKRIEKAYEEINKLGKVNTVSITHSYCLLKHKELRLAYEYALKKQEEKEEQAEIRRQQREQAKLEKEIAEARKAAEKERQHYEQALAAIDAQITTCDDAAHKAELMARRSEIRDGLEGVETKLEDIDYRQANQRAGYVYIISNIGAFGENVYKIGMTRRLNPMERVDELGDASVPFAFDVHAMIFSADAPSLEAALHRAFEDKRINKVNPRREYFHVTLDEIKAVVRENHDKSVEFIDVPSAEQYRQSIRM